MTTKITSTINFYGAHYIDNIAKERDGIAFAAVIDINGSKKQYKRYSPDATYMAMWLQAIDKLMEQATLGLEISDPSTTHLIAAYTCESNVLTILKKVRDIYFDLKDFDSKIDIDPLLDRKMRKSNKSRYEHHDLLCSIVRRMLEINRTASVQIRFERIPPSNSNMRTAHQLADLHLDANQVEIAVG